MTEQFEYETYLSISSNEFKIYLFDTKNLNNYYSNNIMFDNKSEFIDLNKLNQFLDDNIFKIEKLIGQFIKNIFLIIESNSILDTCIGVKKKNYDTNINKKFLKNSLTEVKDLFKENYPNKKIMHIIINRYVVNEYECLVNQNNLQGDYFCLEIQFKSISLNLVSELDKILEKYQIKIKKYLDGNYIKEYFKNEDIDFGNMIHKIVEGQTINEINLIEKKIKKTRFFEKFFQLFS